MIASIVVKGTYNIGVNGNNKIKVDGNIIAISEIPFVRYRFDSYGEKEYKYISDSMDKFHGPIHLIEMKLNDNTKESLEILHRVLGEVDKESRVAKFLYIDIDDEVMANGISDDTIKLISGIQEEYFDRVIIKDKTSGLYDLAADRIKLQIENAFSGAVSFKDIGICGSPLSFRTNDAEGQACLTAVWARKIMSEYAETPDIALPNANHECMTCCGCTRYLVVESDLEAPLSAKEKSANKAASKPTNKEASHKVKEVAKPSGLYIFDM